LDVRYYGDLLWRGRWLVLTAAIVAGGLGLLVGLIQTPEYSATATIQIEPPTPAFMSVSDALIGGGGYWQNADFYNTQYNILHSKTIGLKVVERLKLTDRPPFRDTSDPAGVFMAHVSVEPVPDTRLVIVRVRDVSAQDAALWANTTADVYIEQSITARVDSARRAYDWLQERLSATQENMREAQSRLFKSYQSQDIYVPEGSLSPFATTISKLNEDYIAAQSHRIMLETVLRQAEEMQRSSGGVDSIPQIASDSVILSLNAQLTTLNLQLSQLREQYKEGHPKVHEVQSQVAQITQAKDARARQLLDALRAEFAQTEKRELEIKQAIDAQKAQASAQSRKASELEALKKEADSAKNLYEILLQKLNETDIAASVKSPTASIVERASAPQFPDRPQKKRIAGIAVLLGTVLGIGIVLGREYLANTIKDPDEVERYLHLDLLASVPHYDEANVHLVTEAYQNLRTALLFGRREETGQVVLVTGTAPQEGKTTTLVNIAKLLATSGEKTIALDFDLRRAQLHTRMGLTREPGLTNFFTHHEDLDALIRPTRIANLFVLTAGQLPPNPPAILTRRNLPDLLDRLRRHFEWILLDSPPLASVTDALLLARHVDMSVLVVQHNMIDKKVIKRQLGLLRRANPNLLGAVLNAVNIDAKGYYYYYAQTGGQDAGGASSPTMSDPTTPESIARS
jgi:capsular exopolysaccharide synthesis family protein